MSEEELAFPSEGQPYNSECLDLRFLDEILISGSLVSNIIVVVVAVCVAFERSEVGRRRRREELEVEGGRKAEGDARARARAKAEILFIWRGGGGGRATNRESDINALTAAEAEAAIVMGQIYISSQNPLSFPFLTLISQFFLECCLLYQFFDPDFKSLAEYQKNALW